MPTLTKEQAVAWNRLSETKKTLINIHTFILSDSSVVEAREYAGSNISACHYDVFHNGVLMHRSDYKLVRFLENNEVYLELDYPFKATFML